MGTCGIHCCGLLDASWLGDSDSDGTYFVEPPLVNLPSVNVKHLPPQTRLDTKSLAAQLARWFGLGVAWGLVSVVAGEISLLR